MTTRIAPGVGANLLGQHSAERNQDATAYVGNLDPQVSLLPSNPPPRVFETGNISSCSNLTALVASSLSFYTDTLGNFVFQYHKSQCMRKE